ncbi:MAG: bifunctional riboflavin kinase/FAD synthetase [Bacteroidales bacterium]|nr:bifunctional riboflavin kinase/FAD synthetase [Bacteroidales bacterium]
MDENKFLNLNNVVITIGAFDGVHKGHFYILKEGLNIAQQINGNFIVYTFETHPKKVLPYSNFKLLTTFEEKTFLLQKIGIKYLYIQKFNYEFAQTDADSFVKFLINKFKINTIIIGYDNRFGKDRVGSYETLLKYKDEYKINILKLEHKDFESEIISSTKIRKHVSSGNIEFANKMLGYPYIISGKVIKGLNIGSRLGFPTINLFVDSDKLLPSEGVYISILLYKSNYYRALLSIGNRPTLNINNQDITIEAHILNFNENIYGEFVTLFVLSRLREIIKFENINLLKKQIEKDIVLCNEYYDTNKYDIELQNNLFLFNK